MRSAMGVALVASLLGGCAARQSPAPLPAAAPAGERTITPALHWFRDSAEYRALTLQAYGAATRRVEAEAAARASGSWAVILDADETVIDNSQYQKELELSGGRHTNDAWNDWVRRRQATPVPGARAFLDRVRALGGQIAIVTNRDEIVCDDTRANFREKGLPFDVMLCNPEGSAGDKNPRFEAVMEGAASPDLAPVHVVAWLGDNIRDFPGLGQDLRLGPDESFADFGTRFFVLPNPLYGSWQGNPAR